MFVRVETKVFEFLWWLIDLIGLVVENLIGVIIIIISVIIIIIMDFNDSISTDYMALRMLWSRSNWNLALMAFVEGGKLRNLQKTNNKLNPRETVSTVIKPKSQKW